MRYVLIEAKRSHPELNNKYFTPADLTPWYEKDIEETGKTGVGKYYISFTEIQKVGINPKSPYDTPIGVYTYPVKYIYESYIRGYVPFASNQPYIQVLELTANPRRVLFGSKYTESQWNKDKEICQKIYLAHKDTVLKNYQEARRNLPFNPSKPLPESISEFEDIVNLTEKLNEENYLRSEVRFFTCFWYTTYILSLCLKPKRHIHIWNKLLRKVGYDVIIDKGYGVIHPNERTQAVFLNVKAYKRVDILRNKGLSSILRINDRGYDLNSIPDNLVVQHDLELSGNIRRFPENMEVWGNVTLRNCRVQQPAKKLTCNKLKIIRTEITHIPSGPKEIWVTRSPSVETVSAGTYDVLGIEYTKVKTLPELTVKTLVISGTAIEEIPDNCKILKEFHANYCYFTKAPNMICFTPNTEFFLNGSNLELQDNKLVLRKINVKSDSVTLGEASKVKLLPNNLHLKKLTLRNNTSLNVIPHNLVCGTLTLDNTQVSFIPNNIQVQNLIVKNSEFLSLPRLKVHSFTCDKAESAEVEASVVKCLSGKITKSRIKELKAYKMELYHSSVNKILTLDNSRIKIHNSKIGSIVGNNSKNVLCELKLSNTIVQQPIVFKHGLITITGEVTCPSIKFLPNEDIEISTDPRSVPMFKGDIYIPIGLSLESIFVDGNVIFYDSISDAQRTVILGPEVTVTKDVKILTKRYIECEFSEYVEIEGTILYQKGVKLINVPEDIKTARLE